MTRMTVWYDQENLFTRVHGIASNTGVFFATPVPQECAPALHPYIDCIVVESLVHTDWIKSCCCGSYSTRQKVPAQGRNSTMAI